MAALPTSYYSAAESSAEHRVLAQAYETAEAWWFGFAAIFAAIGCLPTWVLAAIVEDVAGIRAALEAK